MPITVKTNGKNDTASLIKDLEKLEIKAFFARYVFAPRNEKQYEQAKRYLWALMAYVGDVPDSPYNSIIEYLAYLIESYESTHYPTEKSNPVDVLRFLMEQHGLTQSDLPEIGNQGKVSDILHGRRSLNVRHIKGLSERFGIPADVFMA
jgi:HTH-type transcriptional regulator / antitoxin HigA